MAVPGPSDSGHEMEEAFALYRKAQKLIEIGNAFSP